MLKKRAQGLSITTIIVAVIGLIILVVIIVMITGKLGAFSSGVESALSCENTCKAIGVADDVFTYMSTGQECTDRNTADSNRGRWRYSYVPGKFGDVAEDKVCCCRKNI